MIKLAVMTVAAAAALAPAAALGRTIGPLIGSGRPGDPNWAAEAPDRLAPGDQSASRRPPPLLGPSGARRIISTRTGEAGPTA